MTNQHKEKLTVHLKGYLSVMITTLSPRQKLEI